MNYILDITGKEHKINGCLGCEIINNNLKPYGGILFKNENFIITQDFELPIDGFIIISSIRHVEKFTDLNDNERINLMSLINKTLKILRENNVCEEFNIILEEKQGYHFHVWLMPRHKWMIEKFGKVLKKIKPIQDYALKNLRTEENINKISNTCDILKRELNRNNDIKVVTICGSMKFLDDMKRISGELEIKNGYCVIQCVYDIDKNATQEEMANVVNAHWKKIDISDAIYVVNIGGYIGNSTRNEINYALSKGKEVIYHEDIKE